MIEADVRNHLLTDSNITAIIAQRMYPTVLPQSPTLPAVTYFRVSGPREHTLGGASHVNPRIQIDIWALTYAAAKTLADLIRKRLNGTVFIGADADEMQAALLESDQDMYEDETKIFRVSQDYFIPYNES